MILKTIILFSELLHIIILALIILGILLKDPLFKEMDEYVYGGYSYPSYTTYGHSYYLNDPTRLYQADR